MTQKQALEQARLIFPDWAGEIKIERNRCIGAKFGADNEFRMWRIPGGFGCEIIATSYRSYEHMLAIAKSDNEDCWPEDDSPVADEEAESVNA